MARLRFDETMERLTRLIQAGYPIIYLVSHEEARVFDCIGRIVNRLRVTQHTKALVRWSQGIGLESVRWAAGLKVDQPWMEMPGVPANHTVGELRDTLQPDQALDQLKRSQGPNGELGDCVVVFFDLHPYLMGAQNALIGESMVRPLRNAADRLRKYYDRRLLVEGVHRYQTLIIVAPGTEYISTELAGDVVYLDFPLPELPELRRVLHRMIDAGNLKFPNPVPAEDMQAVPGGSETEAGYKPVLLDQLASAGRGLTLHGYTHGLNMIQVEQQIIRPMHVDYLMQLKADTISNPALQFTPRVDISLGGLEGIKEWVRLRSAPVISSELRTRFRLPAVKGVMVCGASGGGKSQLAKLMAKVFGLALLRLDIGSLFGSYVGESEARARQALQLAEVLAPVVLWIDEIDKAFIGAAGGAGDNGVSARVLGHILTWLAEKQDDVFVVVTANRASTLLANFPEFARKGRFDEIFWVGLPSDAARAKIFDIYLAKHLQDGHLSVTADAVTALKSLVLGVPIVVPTEGKPKERLIATLVGASNNMTGAEIQAAIDAALYDAYDQARRGSEGKLTAELLVRSVVASQQRCLFSNGAVPDFAVALTGGWLDADTGRPVANAGPGQAN